MKSAIHPKIRTATFRCAACKQEFVNETTRSDSLIVIDVCNNCHPFYTGAATQQRIAGRAEQFSKKVSAVKAPLEKVERVRARNEKKSFDLADLDKNLAK